MSLSATDEDVQRIIDAAIFHNPFQLGSSDGSATTMLQDMKKKGYRPVTPAEYRETVQQKKALRLWWPLHPTVAHDSDGSSKAKQCSLQDQGGNDYISSDAAATCSSGLRSTLVSDDSVAQLATTTLTLSELPTEAWNHVSQLHYVPTELSFTYGTDDDEM